MSISIIIPSTGERTGILEKTLAAAIQSVEDVDGEIIVIKRKEKPIVCQSPKLRIVNVDFNNVSQARNLGATTAKNDILLFIDDDIVVTASLVTAAIQHHTNNNTILVNYPWEHPEQVNNLKFNTNLGRYLVDYYGNDSYKERFVQWKERNNSDLEWQETIFQSSKDLSECCFSIDKTDFINSGGFNPKNYFGYEGIEFFQKLEQMGMRFFIDPGHVAMHNEIDRYADYKLFMNRKKNDALLINRGIRQLERTKRVKLDKVFFGVLSVPLLPVFYCVISNLSKKSLFYKAYKTSFVYAAKIEFYRLVKL